MGHTQHTMARLAALTCVLSLWELGLVCSVDGTPAPAMVKGSTGCPGSKAWVHHASCDLTAQVMASCDDVMEEVKARVAGVNGWYDPHNRGTYELLSEDGKVLHLQRHTASGGYTDLMDLTFASVGVTTCYVHACSESQVTSYIDYSTNYCNVHDLYCGTADGCKAAIHDFPAVKEHFKDCSYKDGSQCLKVCQLEDTMPMPPLAHWGGAW